MLVSDTWMHVTTLRFATPYSELGICRAIPLFLFVTNKQKQTSIRFPITAPIIESTRLTQREAQYASSTMPPACN